MINTNITILDATPAMADVVSGAVTRPRERRKRENAFRWLVDATTIWPRVLEHFGLADQWPGVEYRPDLESPESLGLGEFPHIYAISWHAPPDARSVLMLANADGTRCAILDAWDQIAELWAAKQRQDAARKANAEHAGRPRIDDESELSAAGLYQRARNLDGLGDYAESERLREMARERRKKSADLIIAVDKSAEL